MITRLSNGVGQKSNSITAKVFNEVEGDLQLGSRLLSAFWSHSLDTLHKEVEYLRVVHHLDHLTVDFAEHQVALFVLERVVQARLGY